MSVATVSRVSSPRHVDLRLPLATVLLWAAIWAVVFALDPGWDYLGDHPVFLIALTVVPQLVLGYVLGPKAALCVLPLAVVWALTSHADCIAITSTGGECEVNVAGFFGIAAILALIWGCLIAVGYGLRVGLARWSGRRA